MAIGLSTRLELASVTRIGQPVDSSAERLMGEVRRYLALAAECEGARQIELADACGAIAANKLARVCRRHP